MRGARQEARGARADLTGVQRACVQHLHRDGMSQSALARRFGVQRRTIQR
ncbi:helix-turn-helix domain-containing protein [Roseiflexus castenholzii]